MFGVKKFHKYLYGRKFVICTDHKPLLSLLNELKAVPQMASQRIMRWAIMLEAYEYVISYRAGKDHGNADALSRLPVAQLSEEEPEEEHVLMLESIAGSLMTAEQIKHWTSKDPVLSRVREYVLKGWPDHSDTQEFVPYNRDSKSSVFQDGMCAVGSPCCCSRTGTGRFVGTVTSVPPRHVQDERISKKLPMVAESGC